METNQQPESPDANSSDTVKPFVTEEAMHTQSEGYNDTGWSWGAFSLNWFFVVAVRRYIYLLLIPLLLVPLVNFVVIVGWMIFMGIKGREMARESRTFSNHEQYLGFMKGVDHAGKIFAFLYITLFALGLFSAIVLLSLGGARERAYEAIERQQEQSRKYEEEFQQSETDFEKYLEQQQSETR